MTKMCALVAAAGRGSRAGLPYPKTLFPIQGVPILVRIADLLAPYDVSPTVIASPEGVLPISECLTGSGISAHVVIQSEPRGMGDAVLCFEHSPAFDEADHILLIWGDVPFIQAQTIDAVVSAHFEHDNDFTFATRYVESAYTMVSRDALGQVTGVLETREMGMIEPQAGERDIGLFLFRKAPVWAALQADRADKWGATTGEHGFLYVIHVLASSGFRVEALTLATQLDLVSLNQVSDVAAYL
jgi:bifunctional UDP-N-acetylglucosamine pyrophosphorylase / glucosamine-1-phosphate N-acetyltransferase